MTTKQTAYSLFCICPDPLWDEIKENAASGTQRISRKESIFKAVVTSLPRLEEAAWKIPNPQFVRSNFGLFGPGVILGFLHKRQVVAALYCLCPSYPDKNVHIWSLVVHPEHRRKGLAKRLMFSAYELLDGVASTFSCQTKVRSDSIPLYLQFGPCKISYLQAFDTNEDWSDPKIGLLLQARNNEIPHPHLDTFDVAANSPFWKYLSEREDVCRDVLLVGWNNDDEENVRLSLQPLTWAAHEFVEQFYIQDSAERPSWVSMAVEHFNRAEVAERKMTTISCPPG